MPNTYGFGGSEPTKDVNAGGYSPSDPAGGTATHDQTGTPLPTDHTIRDAMHTDAIAGTSPVTGLEAGGSVAPSDWEKTSIHPTWDDNCSSPSGAATASLGRWPIQGSALNPSLSKDKGDGDTAWDGSHPGDGDGSHPWASAGRGGSGSY